MLKRLLKNKKGFTLVELLVTMALFSVIGLGAMVLLISTANIFNSTARITNAQTITLQIINTIKSDVYASSEVTIMPTGTTEEQMSSIPIGHNYSYFFFEDNTLFKYSKPTTGNFVTTPMDITGLSINGHLQYTVTFLPTAARNVLKVQVQTFENGSLIYNYETDMEFHNILETVTVAPQEGDPEGEDPQTIEQAGSVIDETAGLGSSCLRYEVPR